MLHKKRKPSTFTTSSNAKVNAAINMLHSKSTYFYRWFSSKKSNEGHSFSNTTYLIPSVCGIALLVGLSLVLNPATSADNLLGESNGSAYAETVTANPTDYSSISMTITNAGSELSDGDTISTNVNPGLMSYIDNNIKISANKINKFYVAVQAAEDGTSELVGTAHPEATIAPVGNNVTVDNFGDNTWGYALVNTTDGDIASSNMTYNSLPASNATVSPQYTSAANLQDGDYNLKLTFAAKINADKPSDHYTTKAMVSVAADAAKLTSMQEFAKVGSCSLLTEPVQLRDSRDDKIYWVDKLKDGNCWMTQNLDLVLAEGSILSSTDTDILDTSGEYTVPALGNYRDPGMVNYKTTAASVVYASSGCGDPTIAEACKDFFEAYGSSGAVFGDEKAHYLIGNYYPWDIAMAGKNAADQGSICPKGWKLPTNSEYSSLINGVTNTNATINTIRTSPYYFVPAGIYYSGYDRVANGGNYWSSTPSGSYSYYLSFSSGDLNMGNFNRFVGRSVRCVMK